MLPKSCLRYLVITPHSLQEDATTSASRRQRAAMMGQLSWLRPEEMRWPVAQGELGLAEAVRSGLGGMVRHMHIQQYSPEP